MSEPNESQKPLDFDLRDRIAAALLRAAYRRGVNRLSNADGEFMADAVIAALGLQRASRPIRELGWREELAPADILHDGYVDPDTQWTYDRHEDAQKRAAIFNQAVAHRYVTDWETNDE